MSNQPLSSLVDLLKVLAHPARLRILALLREGELCVCQIAEVLGGATSTMSEHLTELRKAGLLAERKDGRWVHYGLARRPELEGLLHALWPHLEPMAEVIQDREATLALREIPVEVTCSKSKSCRSRAGKGQRHEQ